jgi:hypothetical protein
MTAMVFCDLSLGSDRTLIMRRVIVHRIDFRRRYLAIFSECRVGNDGAGNKERGNSEHGTRNLEPRGKRVNRLVELPADVQADKLQANVKGAEHFPTNAGVAPN